MAKPNRKKSGPTYQNRPSSDRKSAVIDRVIDGLMRQHGRVDQKMLVAEARDPSHPLHGYFEWDDTIAAEKYRENQALQMIMASKFVVMLNKQGQPTPKVAEATAVRKLLPAFDTGGFDLRVNVLNEADARKELIERKKTQLRSWVRESIDIAELAPLRQAIEALL